ncbi:MAG: hypothetical protein BZ138_00845 [Methanosphaera sp. rholeuAM270]|nr:MAG: hypothetical protein BZ138_00845 [Methanosphaera sp. rholeuAM270]
MKSSQEIISPETQVTIKSRVNRTESQTKVESSILNMVTESNTPTELENDYVIVNGNLSLLEKIKKRIINNGEEDLLTSILEKNRTNSSLTFYINKQSAFNGRLHLIDEDMSTLGDIKVEIFTGNIDEIVNWLKS